MSIGTHIEEHKTITYQRKDAMRTGTSFIPIGCTGLSIVHPSLQEFQDLFRALDNLFDQRSDLNYALHHSLVSASWMNVCFVPDGLTFST